MPVKQFTPTEIQSICAGMHDNNYYGDVTLRFREGMCHSIELSQVFKPDSDMLIIPATTKGESI